MEFKTDSISFFVLLAGDHGLAEDVTVVGIYPSRAAAEEARDAAVREHLGYMNDDDDDDDEALEALETWQDGEAELVSNGYTFWKLVLVPSRTLFVK